MSKPKDGDDFLSWLKLFFTKRPEIDLREPKDTIKDHAWWRRLLNAAGLHIRHTQGSDSWRIHITRRFFFVLAGGFVLALAGMGGFTAYSTSPNFCKSCHIMKPYYEAWRDSKHKDVACVQCHYPPGAPQALMWKKFQALSQVAKFVTRTYSSKPYAEVEDASCLRSGCHSKRLLEGKVVTANGINFDHRPHLQETRRGRQLKCVSCHSQMVMGKHIEVTYDTCYLCHFKDRGAARDLKPLGGCLGCHTLPAKDFNIGAMTYNHKDYVTQRNVSCQNCHLDVVKGDGEAPQDRCFTCHNEPEKLARYQDIPFLHLNHVTEHNIACFHCHQEIRHGFVEGDASRMAKLGEPAPSGAARAPEGHMSVLRFECSYCHRDKHGGQLDMYTGKVGSLEMADMPSPMYLANVDCVGCHYGDNFGDEEREFRGKTYLASDGACVKCHGPSFKGIWEETRKELRKTLSLLDDKLEKAEAGLKKAELSKSDRRRLQSDLATARRLQRFVHASHGEHNIYLASKVLRNEDEALDTLGEKLKVKLPDISADPLISGSYCATMCHEKVGVKVPPVTVKFHGKKMPHKMHTENNGCAACHDIGTHKQVPPRRGREALCKTCHEAGI